MTASSRVHEKTRRVRGDVGKALAIKVDVTKRTAPSRASELFTGKTIIITGAASGIGRATVSSTYLIPTALLCGASGVFNGLI
jgi:NADPH:quinone reductase-like Zn-dependent oxidoreductase